MYIYPVEWYVNGLQCNLCGANVALHSPGFCYCSGDYRLGMEITSLVPNQSNVTGCFCLQLIQVQRTMVLIVQGKLIIMEGKDTEAVPAL